MLCAAGEDAASRPERSHGGHKDTGGRSVCRSAAQEGQVGRRESRTGASTTKQTTTETRALEIKGERAPGFGYGCRTPSSPCGVGPLKATVFSYFSDSPHIRMRSSFPRASTRQTEGLRTLCRHRHRHHHHGFGMKRHSGPREPAFLPPGALPSGLHWGFLLGHSSVTSTNCHHPAATLTHRSFQQLFPAPFG